MSDLARVISSDAFAVAWLIIKVEEKKKERNLLESSWEQQYYLSEFVH